MKKIVFCIISLLFMFPMGIKAYECSNEDKERLQKLANNISVSYEEYEENGKTYFKAIFAGLSKEIRIYSDRRHFYYYNYSNNLFDEVELQVYPGNTYQFTINGSETCKYNDFRTITINIPNYNPYYEDDVCRNAREYKLCKKWVSNNEISYDEFVSKVTEYKKQQGEVIADNSTEENGINGFTFLDIYNKYYWPTFVGMICSLILLILLWIKQNKKNRL